jgi:hypothetical protein
MSDVEGSSGRYLPDGVSLGRAHPEIEEQLAAYTAGALGPVERQRVMAHLEGCPACGQALAEVCRVRRLLRTLADTPTSVESAPSVADAVMARLADAGAAGAAWPEADPTPSGTWALLEDEATAGTPDPSLSRPVLDEPGVLSPDFRPAPPLGNGRGRARDEWWLLSGGSEGEDYPMARLMPRNVDDRLPVPAPARSRRDGAPAYPAATRWNGFAAVAATAAIMLMSALVLGVLGPHLRALGPGGGPTPSGTATPTPAGSQAALLPHGAVSSISMVSAAEGWAVGPVSPGGSSILLHYTSGKWVRARDVFPRVVLTSVSMDSAQDGWAVGWDVKAVAGIFLHYTGGHWVVASDSFLGMELHSIAMRSADDGWAVGVMRDQFTGVVLHYTGGHWTQVQPPFPAFSGMKVQPLSSEDVWVVALLHPDQTGHSRSVLLHYQNGAWSSIWYGPGSPQSAVSDIAMFPDGEGWATSYDDKILHYQAGELTEAASTAGQMLALQMSSPNEGWAVGSIDTPLRRVFIMRYDGKSWTQVPGPAALGKSELTSVAIVSSGEIWAGGDEALSSGATPVTTSAPASVSGVSGVSGQQTPAPDGTPVVPATPTPAPLSGGAPAATATPLPASMAGTTTVAILFHYSNGRWEQVPLPVS